MQSARDTIRIGDGWSAEILVVDDGSDDKTGLILDALADRFSGDLPPRIVRFAQNTIGGAATASNYGLDHARGDLIVFIDGDDWVCPEALARAIAAMRAGGFDLLVTDCAEYWNDTGQYTKWPEALQWEALETVQDDTARRSALLRMAPFPWRKIYRRGFLDDAGIRFPVGDFFFEDNPFHWEAVLKAPSWGWLRAETHIHRRARAGQSLERRDSGYLRIFDHFDTLQAMLDQTGTATRHAPELMDWLLRHTLWAASRLALEDWPALFQVAHARLARMPRALFWDAIQNSDRSAAETRQLIAAHQGEWPAFLRGYDPIRIGNPRDHDRG